MAIAGKARGKASTDLEVLLLICEAEPLDGNHVHRVWRGQVVSQDMPRAKTMIMKWLDDHLAVCVELACALAAQSLGLRVPAPAIVVAPREFVHGIPAAFESGEVLLVGSEYKVPDAFLASVTHGNPAAEEFVWNKLCASDMGAAGAAWDELLANDDRHHENAIFDGSHWWLFDHDRALVEAGPFSKNPTDTAVRLALKNFRAKSNNLAAQMVKRLQSNHGISAQPAEFARNKAALSMLAQAASKWTHSDLRIKGIFKTTAILLTAIELRLSALALHIQARIQEPSAADLWKQDSN
jgi:hypothetical protein